jgi:hypothetical protein
MASSDWLRLTLAEDSDRLPRAEAARAVDTIEAIGAPRELRDLVAEVEGHLRDIDFVEVTAADRITYVEYAVAWRVRVALRKGRFDLALWLNRYGQRRIAELQDGPGREASSDEMLLNPDCQRSSE